MTCLPNDTKILNDGQVKKQPRGTWLKQKRRKGNIRSPSKQISVYFQRIAVQSSEVERNTAGHGAAEFAVHRFPEFRKPSFVPGKPLHCSVKLENSNTDRA